MNPNIAKLIKITSTTLITGALGLELWNVYLMLNDAVLPDNIRPFFWIGSIALVAHGIEGVIAAFKVRDRAAKSQPNGDLNPITYGIYTFFVGFVGLQELSSTTD